MILINFKDNTSQPFSKSTVQTAITGSATSVKKFFEEEGKGRWTVNGTVYGWYTLNTTSTLMRLEHVGDDGRQRGDRRRRQPGGVHEPRCTSSRTPTRAAGPASPT